MDCGTLENKKTPYKILTSYPLQVFCRIKKMDLDPNNICVRLADDHNVVVSKPTNKILKNDENKKEVTCSFTKVLSENSSQKECYKATSHEMVKDLVAGKNGVIFTYGITGSGKTYTIGGTHKEPGILPNCIVSLFNKIDNNTIPDGMVKLIRGREIESVAKVCDLFSTTSESCGAVDTQKAQNKDHRYAVFISLVDIYNNQVYDLFDSSLNSSSFKGPLPKAIREEPNSGTYVQNLTYVPVLSVVEALQVYRKGRKKRKVAQTLLNAESSRSHSVFTIYLCKITHDDEKNSFYASVSQLSLSDLAGSERTSRTHNEGERLKETSSINSSLMVLKSCIDTLRENQKHLSQWGSSATIKVVPYRESKLTYLFRNFFEGRGRVRMIICISPIGGDYEENLHVLRFAESSKVVQINICKENKVVYISGSGESCSLTSILDQLKKETQDFESYSMIRSKDFTNINSLIDLLIQRDEKMFKIWPLLQKSFDAMEKDFSVLTNRNERLKADCESIKKEAGVLKRKQKALLAEKEAADEAIEVDRKQLTKTEASFDGVISEETNLHFDIRKARKDLRKLEVDLAEAEKNENLRFEEIVSARIAERMEKYNVRIRENEKLVKTAKEMISPDI